MTDFFEHSRPLIKQLTEELSRLKLATDEIDKAGKSAVQHEQAATQQKNTAEAAVRAVQLVVTGQEKLIDQLGQQHQRSLGEQEVLLREQSEQLSQKTGEQIGRQLNEVRQTAEQVQELIDRLLADQPTHLDAIGRQHQQGLEKQQEMLRNGVQSWADKLHEQLQVELKLLRQATEVLEKNTRQQHDELSAVASLLQVVAGRVTAFAEVMNAARFTARLESIEQLQKDTLADLAASRKASEAAAAKLMELQRGQQQAADTAGSHREAYELRVDVLKGLVEQLSGQQVQAGQQQRLWQLITLGTVVVVGVVLFLARHN